MRTTVSKLFFVNQHEKEEEWLNDMAANGKAMLCYKFPCFYEFENCEPNEYTYRIEMLENGLNHYKSREYIEFLEEIGIETMDSYLKWVYFRKKTKDGPFDLFSDLESKIRHYQRIFRFLTPFFLLEASIFILFLSEALASGYIIHNFSYGIIGFCTFFLGYFEVSLFRKIMKLKKEKLIRE